MLRVDGRFAKERGKNPDVDSRGANVLAREAYRGYEAFDAGTSVRASSRVARIIAFVAFTSIGAQASMRLPMTPVPVTMQTLFAVLAGMVLGPRDGFVSMLAYVGAGLAGAPVFADFSFGPWAILGPTGGYIVSFPMGALVSGVARERSRGTFPELFLAALLGSSTILLIGSSYLAALSGLSPGGAFLAGVAPFVYGEAVKAVIASATVSRIARRGNIRGNMQNGS